MAQKVLALTVDGKMTYCTCPPERRGTGRCNHVAHQNPEETAEEFAERVSVQMSQDGPESKSASVEAQPVNQQEIDTLAQEIDRIAGCRVTAENIKAVLPTLTPDQIDQIAKIGFDAAPVFSLPIRDADYEEENVKNKLYFANLHQYGVGGSSSAIAQMFDKVGPTPVHGGKIEDIEHSYEEGLTPEEHFAKSYYARTAMITKGVKTAEPGYTARKLFYAFSDTQVMTDCGGPYVDAMHCKLPNGHVCIHCAHMTKGGETVKEGDLVGGVISTRLSEGLTQASMELKHTGTLDSISKGQTSKIIMATLDGWSTSPIIQRMQEATSTEEMRQTLYEGLKAQYAAANLKMDDFNLQMTAKKMTSYKRVKGEGLRPVEESELPDVVSIGAVGNANNIFKAVELESGYRILTRPMEQQVDKDAANQLLN